MKSLSWDDFDVFAELINRYMPDRGEGETIASQICTAVNKLVYKWFNDGDVFDNTHYLSGWANDLSSYANWLYSLKDICFDGYHTKETRKILDRIKYAVNDDVYTKLLYDLCDLLINEEFLDFANEYDKKGSIYKCEGKFKFIENYDDEDNGEW